MKIKNTAITYTGYEYQTLHGVRILAEWLGSPSRYIRVAFEADLDANEAPQGIDDIVCERLDGIKDFWQVKFTPSPEKEENHLSWEWLLEIKGKTDRSRSILQKTYDAIKKVPPENLGDVVFLTNKLPSRTMEACIRGAQIDFTLIEENFKHQIINQLGSLDAAEFLFSRLTIQHSDKSYLALKNAVRSDLLKFSDEMGVGRLIEKAREWATHENNPPEDGWIYLQHVREVLSLNRPKAIPEIFVVPDGYCLPNSDFHDDLFKNISSSSGEIITLTGKPGSGKSTYLSFLCQALEELEIPVIRHHYFLSLGDTTEDRLSPRIVAESLLYQISRLNDEFHTDTSRPENLRDALLACASYYKSKSKPLVVLIDGLDHVWRDNAKDKKPLVDTFRQLLPVVENLVLLVGTQPVSDELLPDLLLSHSPKNEWLYLPEMSGNSLYEYLKHQIESERLFLNCHENNQKEELQNSASMLLEVTGGYPLHVIYSTEYLAHRGLPLSSWQIEKLPPCSGGDITNYYSELWRNLGYKQKDILHLCCSFQFAWPRQALSSVIEDDHELAPSVDAVAHLLTENICGVRPFHESLVVFVREQEEHAGRVTALLPTVCSWLGSEAPLALKDSWYWLCLAKNGDSSMLRQGVTRDWVLDRLILGMPTESCIRLLSEAETYAFQEQEYAEAYGHRALKTRLMNGPEFQTWNSSNLSLFSLVASEESYFNEALTREAEYSPANLSILATALWYRGEYKSAALLSEKSISRYKNRRKLTSSRKRQADNPEEVAIVKAGVLTDTLNYDAIFVEDHFSKWPTEYINAFIQACCLKGDLDLLFKAIECLHEGSDHLDKIVLNTIRLSVVEEAGVTGRPEFLNLPQQYLFKFLDVFLDKKYEQINTFCPKVQSEFAFKLVVENTYHEWFFSSLNNRLNAEGDFCWLPIDAVQDRFDVSAQYMLLNQLAGEIADLFYENGQISFDTVCQMLPSESVLVGSQWEARRAFGKLKHAWLNIAADLHLITTGSIVSASELQNTVLSEIFNAEVIRSWYAETGLKIFDDSAAQLLIKLEEARQEEQLEETINYSNAYLEVTNIAYQHHNEEDFKKSLRKTWDFVLGYCYHKDLTIYHVLESVEYLSKIAPIESLKILEKISPIISAVNEFTDGDETRHSIPSMYSLLAKLNPQTVASIYERNVSDGEWYHADQALVSLLEESDFSSPLIKAIYLTGLHSDCHAPLNKQIEQGNIEAAHIAEEVKKQLGADGQSAVKNTSPSSSIPEEKIKVLPENFPPSKFEELLVELKKESFTYKFWPNWYEYWCTQGQELELVQCLEPRVASFTDLYDDKRYLLDPLYHSIRKLKGKRKAFKILTAAHRTMGGWADWYENSKNSIERLKIVADQYPSQVDEFVALTTIKPNNWFDKSSNLIIPDSKLVYLLVASGKQDHAIKLTNEMVSRLEEDVRNLKLEKPSWDWRDNETTEELLVRILVARLKLPVPSIKLWVVEQLALLLEAGNTQAEKILIADLASRKQESECVEVLCVFLAAKNKGYNCPIDLGKHINARSVLSDLILSNLVSEPVCFGEYAFPFLPVPYLNGDNNRFDYYQGSHVQRLYLSKLKEEEERTGLPFVAYCKSEWNVTFEYQPPAVTEIDYFFGVERQRSTGQFYTQASHRGRSAYLRTIDLAREFYGMPDWYAERLAVHALPVEPAYLNLYPQKPDWLPCWDRDKTPDEKGLISFAEDIINIFNRENSTNELYALSYPIKINENNWIDLTVVKGLYEFEPAPEVKIGERVGCYSIGDFLEGELTYYFTDSSKNEGLLASVSYPFTRYGHWHSDLETRGIYVPVCFDDNKKLIASSCEGSLNYFVDGVNVGFSIFWYNDWQPTHPFEIRSLCGSYTVVNKEQSKELLGTEELKKSSYYLCKATLITSDDYLGKFNKEEISFWFS